MHLINKKSIINKKKWPIPSPPPESTVAVPSSTTLATMRCQSNRFSEALMSSVGLILSILDSPKLSTYFSLWRPLAFLSSIFPNTTKFSRPCFFNSCPRKASCHWRILFISVRCTFASLNTVSSLLFFSLHNIFSILRKNQTSTAINLSFITFKIVHVSHPYNRTD